MRQKRTAEGGLGRKTGRGFVVFARRWLGVAAFIFGWHGHVVTAQEARAAERAKPSVPAKSPSHRPTAPASAGQNPPEQAVVFDETIRPPAKDLQLALESDRKAEAIAHYLQGILLEETADDKANDEYLKSLTLDPSNIGLAIKVAWRYAGQGNSADAIGLLKDSIKALPKQADPYLALSYLYFKVLNKYDLAQKYAAQALEIDPNNILVYQYLKEVYTALGQQAKIGPLLERAAKSDRKDPAFWLRLGGLYADFYLKSDSAKSTLDTSKTGTDGAAKPDPAKAPELLKKTAAIYQKALALSDNDPDIVSQVADFYAETQQFADAVPLYQRSIEAEPSQTQARENLARCYLALDQKDKAIAALEELIQVNPVQNLAYEMLANIYEKNNDPAKAIANYEQSLLISPNQPDNYFNLGNLLLEQRSNPDNKYTEKAVNVLSSAHRRFPDRPIFTRMLATALSAAKQYQPALTIFEQALLDAQNGQPELLDSGFFFLYGATAEQAGLYDKAGPLLQKSMQLESRPERLAQTANYLGYMYVDHSIDIEEGGKLIQRALEVEPDNAAYRDSLGWYYFRTNQFDKALAELTRAAEQMRAAEPFKDDPTVLEHLGDTYAKLKDMVNAVSCWQKAVALTTEEPSKTELTKKIEGSKAQLTQGPPPPAAAPEGKPR